MSCFSSNGRRQSSRASSRLAILTPIPRTRKRSDGARSSPLSTALTSRAARDGPTPGRASQTSGSEQPTGSRHPRARACWGRTSDGNNNLLWAPSIGCRRAVAATSHSPGSARITTKKAAPRVELWLSAAIACSDPEGEDAPPSAQHRCAPSPAKPKVVAGLPSDVVCGS